MFCQQCGAELLSTTKFCVRCGHKLKVEGRISNKALILAGIAAAISVGSALLSFLPRDSPTTIQEPIVMAGPSPSVSPAPRSSPTPTRKPRQTPEPPLEPTPKSIRPRLEPTPNHPYKHNPTLDSPADGAVLSFYPRRLILHWTRNTASEAVRYKVTITHGSVFQSGWILWEEIETSGEWHVEEMFPCACRGRWRVTPILADGRSGVPTEWRTFRFTR